jgi:flagellar basal-body rod modification protein FlgD
MSTVASPTSTTATPSAASALSGITAAGGTMDKDAFMKILVAELKNQDPENQMDGKEMAAQLAQFSNLEQLMQMNAKLDTQDSSQAAMTEAMQHAAAVNTIGRTVTAVGNAVAIGNGASGAVTVVTEGIGTGTLTIKDAAGNVVGTRDLGTLDGGRQTIELGDAAKGLKDGAYSYTVEVTSPAGKPLGVTEYTTGKVDGVAQGPNGPVLKSGPLAIEFTTVAEVTQ